VAGNVTDALIAVFGPVAVVIVGLVTSRHELLARLRRTTPTGIPLLTEATALVAGYLEIERERGRIAADADVGALAPMLVGSGHLLLAGRESRPLPEEVHRVVTAALAGVTTAR
jgi:hypothetical protein